MVEVLLEIARQVRITVGFHWFIPRRFYSSHRSTKVSVDASVLLSQVTGWDGELDESDSLQDQVGMDSLQAVEFRRILCVQVGLTGSLENKMVAMD